MAGIYLHIPFCKRRCIYCDFYSTTCIDKQKAYVDALCNEIKLRKDYLKINNQNPIIETIYIGGGTPSTLSRKHIETLLDTIFSTYEVSPQAEITMEANPDDLTGVNPLDIRYLPINRMSLGIQTFDDHQLRFLNRRHTGQQAIEAIIRCKEQGVENISIDLIYGLPGQNLSDWEKELETAIKMDIKHISAYSLIYEEGTPLWNMRMQHLVKEAEEDISLKMFTSLIQHLEEAGFEHYEISNFARPGHRSRHNSSYWKGVAYLGCGTSAHSFDGNNRQWNIADLDSYISHVSQCTTINDFIHASWIEKEELTLYEKYNDRIITALRTSDGLDLDKLQSDFGTRLKDYCLHTANRHLQNGILENIKKNEQSLGLLKLTRQGLFLSDGIMSDLLFVED